MDDGQFDKALVEAALAIAGEKGWRAVTVARAAQRAALDLGRARARFPARLTVLMRLGVIADQAALAGASTVGPVRDRLFDMIMQRLDVFQAQRDGIQALLRYLPSDPGLALLLALATRRSMRWLLDAAGISTQGLRGGLRVRGLLVVWLVTLRAWERDDSIDLSATMRALDEALQRAERAVQWLDGRAAAGPEVAPDEAAAAVTPAAPPPAAGDDELPPMPPSPLDTPPEPEPPAAPMS